MPSALFVNGDSRLNIKSGEALFNEKDKISHFYYISENIIGNVINSSLETKSEYDLSKSNKVDV